MHNDMNRIRLLLFCCSAPVQQEGQNQLKAYVHANVRVNSQLLKAFAHCCLLKCYYVYYILQLIKLLGGLHIILI